MNNTDFKLALRKLSQEQNTLTMLPNTPAGDRPGGVLTCYKHPVITREHIPIHWRYDLDYEQNPLLLERLGINATYNAGAIEFDGKITLMVRVEEYSRKSIFALAQSDNGIDNFRFIGEPIVIDQTDSPETNIYDPRLVLHEDGWIYVVFCAERKDHSAGSGDTETAIASAGIARSRDMKTWQRLGDLKTPSPQQRNAVLHPEFVDGKYAFYTRPQDGFISAGSGGGIGWGLSDSIEEAEITDEIIIDSRDYHTIKESKNGLGPGPIKTEKGWLNLAHGVRDSASGLRYTLYSFLTDLAKPWKVIASPSGYLLSPRGSERCGDVFNVVFSNGWVAKDNGDILLYYASSDQRMHVATTTVEKMLDYVINTPADPGNSYECSKLRASLARRNMKFLDLLNDKQHIQ